MRVVLRTWGVEQWNLGGRAGGWEVIKDLVCRCITQGQTAGGGRMRGKGTYVVH